MSEAAEELEISRYTAHDRIRRLKFLSNRPNLPSLVHWGLRERLFSYDYPELEQIDNIKLQIVNRLAGGQSDSNILKAMPSLTKDALEGHIRRARSLTKTNTRTHLVAICWTEGWIV